MMLSILIFVLVCGNLSEQQDAEKDEYIFISKRGTEPVIVVACKNDKKIEDILYRRQNLQPLIGNIVLFDKCLPPRKSYADVFIVLEINVTTIEELILRDIPNAEPSFHANHFVGLSLLVLNIGYRKDLDYRPCPATDILVPLKILTKLTLSCTDLLPLPMSTSLEKLSLESGSSLGSIGGCENLREILAEIWKFKETPMGWLSNCPKLATLTLRWVFKTDASQLIKKMLFGARTLRKLTLQYCTIRILDTALFVDNVNLQYLEVIQAEMVATRVSMEIPSLEHLILSYNKLRESVYISALLTKTPALRRLELDSNELLDLCDNTSHVTADPFIKGNFNLSSLEEISADNTATSKLCFSNLKLDSLKKLSLMMTKVQTLEFQGLPMSKVPDFIVSLELMFINDIRFEQMDYYRVQRQHITVWMFNISLDCDCQNAWLARAAREKRVKLFWEDASWGEHTLCKDGKTFLGTPQQQLECDKYSCVEVCTCRTWWQHNATDAYCAGELRAVPRVPDLRALHAPNNLLENITTDDLPDTLLMLNISGNHVKRIDDAAVRTLFNATGRRMLLAGNPLICDCENRELLAALKDHHRQVEDFDKLTCANDGRAVSNVTIEDLCSLDPQAQLAATLASVGVLVALVAVAAALYYRYERDIKVFLFARGWCLICLHEEEIDADRQYDAFLSFSHADSTFALETLLPELEREPHPYKICVHTRDWLVGEFIPAQITRSVHESRRTIIVLTNNFLQSVWGMLEFRAAHVSTVQEGRVRIIAILLDDIDIDDEKIDAELRGYLKSNTYLKWGDAWFWDKLRFAMPHYRHDLRNSRDSRISITANDSSHNNPISMQQLQLENGRIQLEQD